MNIVFMGTPDFAVESLKKLYEAGHNILAVVSQPDKPTGRGMKLTPTPTKTFALEKNIKVLQPEKVRKNTEFIEEIKSLKPDIIVVVAYGKILPQEILEIPKRGCINVHGSLLPKYRGAAPIQWSIISGDKETGITTMYMDKGMDTGDMLLKEVIPIEPNDTYGTLYEKLKKLGGIAIVKTIERMADGTISRQKQPEEFTVAPMIFKENCQIDWSKSAESIKNLVRGVNPMPGAWTKLGENIYKIWECDNLDASKISELSNSNIDLTEKKPGTVLISNSKIGLYILTGDGIISIKEIQAPNSKRMNILDYLRGKTLETGSIMQ